MDYFCYGTFKINMKDYTTCINEMPELIVRGNYTFRYLISICIIGIMVYATVLYELLSFATFIIEIVCVLLFMVIRYPRIELYDDKVSFIKKGQVKFVTETDTILLKDIEKIEFYEGHVDWFSAITMALTGISSMTDNIPEKFNIYTKDNRIQSFKRIGAKSKFISFLKLFEEKIKKANN